MSGLNQQALHEHRLWDGLDKDVTLDRDASKHPQSLPRDYEETYSAKKRRPLHHTHQTKQAPIRLTLTDQARTSKDPTHRKPRSLNRPGLRWNPSGGLPLEPQPLIPLGSPPTDRRGHHQWTAVGWLGRDDTRNDTRPGMPQQGKPPQTGLDSISRAV